MLLHTSMLTNPSSTYSNDALTSDILSEQVMAEYKQQNHRLFYHVVYLSRVFSAIFSKMHDTVYENSLSRHNKSSLHFLCACTISAYTVDVGLDGTIYWNTRKIRQTASFCGGNPTSLC